MVDLIHVPPACSGWLPPLKEPAAWYKGETGRCGSSRIRVAVASLTDLLGEPLGQDLSCGNPQMIKSMFKGLQR